MCIHCGRLVSKKLCDEITKTSTVGWMKTEGKASSESFVIKSKLNGFIYERELVN